MAKMTTFNIRCTFYVLYTLTIRTGISASNLGIGSSLSTKSYDNEPIGESCQQLREHFKPDPLNVLFDAKNRYVDVMWGARAPVRVAAALMVVVLRYVHGYELVRLRQGPRRLCHLVSGNQQLPHPANDGLDTMYIHMGAEWSGENEVCNPTCAIHEMCHMTGPRLDPSGAATAATARLYTRLATRFLYDKFCNEHHSWPFYKDQIALLLCGFLDLPANVTGNCPQNETCIQVMDVTALGGTSAVATELEMRANATGIRLHVVPIDRATLHRILNDNDMSVVFIDYELWSANSFGVRALQPPPCVTDAECTDALDSTTPMQVSDLDSFRYYAPLIDLTIRKLKPNATQLRQLLDLETETNNTIEATCAWAFINSKQIKEWTNATDVRKPVILKLMCAGDQDLNEYTKVTNLIKSEIKTSRENIPNIVWYQNVINCTDANAIGNVIEDFSRHPDYLFLAGVAAMVGSTAVASEIGAENAQHFKTQLALCGVPSAATRLYPATTAVTGRHNGLALALRRFLALHGWKRIAIISEKTVLANDFSAALLADGSLVQRDEKLDVINHLNARNALKKLIVVDARVFVVNAGAHAACVIACAAHSLQITDANHAWIFREWEPRQCTEAKNMRVFSLSYAWRGRAGLTPQQNETKILGERRTQLRAFLDGQWEDSSWPLHASALADALLALVHALSTALKYNPSLLYNLHDTNAASNISKWAAQADDLWGVAQRPRPGAEPQRATVFVEEWRPPAKRRARLLAAWALPAGATDLQSIEDVEPLAPVFDSGKVPHDGTPGCWTALKGEPFTARCLDTAFGSAVAVLLLAPLVLWAAARARKARLKRRERALLVRLLARCERTAEALRPLLVSRHALTLRDKELGAGHFGRVTLGLLRLPHRPPVAVAAKALRADSAPAEEAEFLREGCALAALQHAHVVRLLGVCAADGPPLLLMEYAFFGDLLRYLQERRHLAEVAATESDLDSCTDLVGDREVMAAVEPEATHVSATALTRLAKEAAEALAYLAKRRYVHRDVRAANCLIDASRTLKLADFGLARATSSERDTSEDKSCDSIRAEESYAYICRRRGVFPVPWMAPESLTSGMFSAASDAWALGVLMLELATLGARPYGAWRPPKVLRFVRDGGRPPLPRDASYHMCEVTAMCWERQPICRAKADTVGRYLVAHPRALRPALRPALLATTEPDDVDYATDSGFGERDIDDWLRNERHACVM